MFLTLKELGNWLGLSVFEIATTLTCTLTFTVLTVLKLEGTLEMTWWTAFSPLFVCDALNSYFCVIVYIRMHLDGLFKAAALRAIWSFFFISLIFVSKLLLCQRLQGKNQLRYSEIMSPVFILAQLIMIRACQLH